MIWISIILAIIEAIPTIIDLIKKIIDLIHGHPLQIQHEITLHKILSDWHHDRDNMKVLAALHGLHASM